MWTNIKQIFAKDGRVLFEDVPAKVDIVSQVSSLHVFIDGASTAREGTPFLVDKHKKLTIQTYGNPSSFVIEVKGRLRNAGDYVLLSTVDMGDFAVSSQINKFGIYSLDIAGLYDVTIDAVSVAGGYLNVVGRGVV